jgi:hypothetical protein
MPFDILAERLRVRESSRALLDTELEGFIWEAALLSAAGEDAAEGKLCQQVSRLPIDGIHVPVTFPGAPILHQRTNVQELKLTEMKKLLEIASVALIVLGAALLFERPAYAYADPGTGLLAIQAVGSALVASGWYLRKKIYSLLHRGVASGRQPDELSATEEDEGAPSL